jgi:hypothetical protein
MNARLLGITRASIGLGQGFGLYLLNTFPPTAEAGVLAALRTVLTFIPVVLVASVGVLRTRTLVIWMVAATLVCASLAYYDIFRDPLTSADVQRVVPSWSLWIALAVGLFIAHSLIISSDLDRTFFAPYPRYFDTSWKLAAQWVLAVVFVAVFWGVLWLGAGLFALVKIDLFANVIAQPLFFFPATTLMLAIALHITDVRAELVRGIRTVKLSLLSWLLPLMAILAAAFLAVLPFTGLEPLWSTRRATLALLTAAGVLILLTNAVYQDGRSENGRRPALRYARSLAAIILLPLVLLAGYGLLLRVLQYGWTPQRVFASACILVSGCYAFGYLATAKPSGGQITWVERTNVVTAYVVLAVLLALFSPIADPARIAVADQLHRLGAGVIEVEKVDYAFFRFGSGRYGRAALEQLASATEGPSALAIASRAGTALRARNPSEIRNAPLPATPDRRAANITVIYPPGGRLSDSFLKQDWITAQQRGLLPACLTSDVKCEAVLVDLDEDGQPEVLLLGPLALVFKLVEGVWTSLGSISNTGCPGVRDALRKGDFMIAQPKVKDIQIGDARLRVTSGCVAQLPSRVPQGR